MANDNRDDRAGSHSTGRMTGRIDVVGQVPGLRAGRGAKLVVPLDIDTIVASVKKTGRCVILHEASRFGGFGGELSALVQERCFWELKNAVQRVAGRDTPYPHAFEWDYFPGPAQLAAALARAMED